MSNTLRAISDHVQRINLTSLFKRPCLWAEFYVEHGEGRLRYFVQRERDGEIGVWDRLADACADYDGNLKATSFVVPEGKR